MCFWCTPAKILKSSMAFSPTVPFEMATKDVKNSFALRRPSVGLTKTLAIF